MRAIKLMADYECFPLWEASPGLVGNIDPATLPISDALKERLAAWARVYDGILNRDDPAASDFSTANEEAAFKREGETLAQALQGELGDQYAVVLQV